MTAITVTIGHFNANGQHAYDQYAAGVLPLLQKIGAKAREHIRGGEALAGGASPDLVAVLEFPDEASIKSFLASTEYTALLVHREEAFSTIQSFIGGGF